MKLTEVLKNSGKTFITQILLDIRKALKKDVKDSKTNFTGTGAEMVFTYVDGVKYRITVESVN